MDSIMALESETLETLEAAALQLTRADRARLVDRLIAILDADPDVEEAWAAEVERRQAELKLELVFIAWSRNPYTLNKLQIKLHMPRSDSCGFKHH